MTSLQPKKGDVRTLNIAGFTVRLTRKRVKNVNLRIRPGGEVAVSAPCHVSAKEIERFVESKRSWIEKALERYSADVPDPFMEATDEQKRQWRGIVEAFVPPLVQKWEPILGVRAGKLAYRNMKSRWGSCQPSTGRICINTRLALYPPECLEYVVVHELCHLLVRGHGKEFYGLLDSALPGWRKARKRLSLSPDADQFD